VNNRVLIFMADGHSLTGYSSAAGTGFLSGAKVSFRAKIHRQGRLGHIFSLYFSLFDRCLAAAR
ncbi:MAG TPA: hypothetical protein DCY27_00685, partial [Desulfobacterales bacterium]|nr:hypothetical protein [Desulfobacterales bacterium]